MLSAFRKDAILTNIMTIEGRIRANGVPATTQSRLWTKLAFFQGKVGDFSQQKTALDIALELDPNNAWAKKQQAELTAK